MDNSARRRPATSGCEATGSVAANIFFMVLTVAFGVLVAPASILVIVLGGAWAVTEWRSGAIVARRQIARSVLIGCVLSMTFLIGLGTWWDK